MLLLLVAFGKQLVAAAVVFRGSGGLPGKNLAGQNAGDSIGRHHRPATTTILGTTTAIVGGVGVTAAGQCEALAWKP